jgi:hypothetical protein
MSQNPILKAGSASDVTNRNKGRVEYGNILGQQMAVEAGILPSVTLQKGGGGSAASRVTSILGASVVTAAERTTAVTNLISNVSINATTALRLSAAALGTFGITNIPGAVTTTTPGAPTGLVATPSSQTLSIAFSINTGNSPITNYSYSMDGTTYRAFSPAQTSSPVTITTLTDGTTALTNGTSYTVYLRATNAIGIGPASAPVTATPIVVTAPSAPTSLVATGSDRTLSIAFSVNNGGSAITNYSYSITGVGGTYIAFNPAQTSGPVTITTTNGTTLLSNGVLYTVFLKATNAIGTSVASSSVTGTPAIAPSAPISLVATSGNQSVSISFDNINNNGSAITNYSYSFDGTNYTVLNPAQTSNNTVSITGLTNGTSYTVYLKGINAVGTGGASSPLTFIAGGVPTAPTSVTATWVGTSLSDRAISVAFTAPSTNVGVPITNYSYSETSVNFIPLDPPQTTSPLTLNLPGTTSQVVSIRAINAVGSGTADLNRSITGFPVIAYSSAETTANGISNISNFIQYTNYDLGKFYYFICNSSANKIWVKDGDTNQTTLFAGSGTAASTDGTGAAASFNGISAIAVGKYGSDPYTIYICEYNAQRVRRITINGVVTTFSQAPTANYNSAMSWTNGFAYVGTEDGKVLNASLSQNQSTTSYYSANLGITGISGIAFDSAANVFSCKTSNNTIYKSAGGTNAASFATIPSPINIAIATSNNMIYVTSSANNNLYKITDAGVVSIRMTLPITSAPISIFGSLLYISIGTEAYRMST